MKVLMPTNDIRFVFGDDLLKKCWVKCFLLKEFEANFSLFQVYVCFPGASELQMNFWWISSYGWRVVYNFPVNFMLQICWNRLRYLPGSCYKNFPSFWKIAIKFEGFGKLAIFWAFVKDLESGHKITFKNKLKKRF